MKTKCSFIALLCLFFSIQSLQSQVYRYIPDPDLRNYLNNYLFCPFDPSGDSLDISSSVVSSTNSMNFSGPVTNLDGLQYFTNLLNITIQFTNIPRLNHLPNSIEYLYVYGNYYLRYIDSLPSSLLSLNCTNDSLVSLCILPPNLNELDCSNNQLRSLPDLPASLQNLMCSYNPLDSLPSSLSNLTSLRCNVTPISFLPTLPATLLSLDIGVNNISSLPILPPNLNLLSFPYNNISSMPSLPNSLIDLIFDGNSISTIPVLPPNLVLLSCSQNLLSALPTLPSSLLRLACGGNTISSLPTLPPNLIELSCNNNLISVLPILPDSITSLQVDQNLLTSLPALPINLITFYCTSNAITSLPTLPPNLELLFASGNNLSSIPTLPNTLQNLYIGDNINVTCLPFLPHSLRNIEYTYTGVTCIPNFVSGANYNPTIGTFPFCNPSFHTCPSFNSLEGTTYKDLNSNCINDLSEDKLMNIPLVLQNGSSIIYQASTATNGTYAFDTLPIGIYTIHVDTLELPFDVYCPVSGYDTIHKDSITDYFTNRDFGFHCKSNVDLATTGLIRNSWIRPANMANFNLHAGDIAKIFGTSCSTIPATITIDYTGHLNYSGVGSGGLLPDTILPNHVVWNIANVSTLDFYNSIAPSFFVDSTAISGDIICFNISISPTVGDRIPSNNSISQCFNVVASYDPNIKEVSPSGTITSTQDWMNYTIHFQNTGTSYAENIYVWDTIDPNLDLNTIQVTGASHNQIMQVNPSNRAVLFNFSSIHLPDSTTDEQASHGWVQYRIKPKAGLSEGIQINNTAAIYFDLNTPIYTNTTSNRICNTPSNISQTYTITEGQSITVGTHTYNQTGSYTDILSNVNGCDSTVNTTIQVISGIGETTPIRLITYPNPANNLVNIEIEGIPNMPLTIVDMYGRTVYENTSINNRYSINTESLMSGNYIIQYGRYHQKLVINH